jgi:hypothetical protein
MEFFINVMISFLLGFIFSYLLDLNKRVRRLESKSSLHTNQIDTIQSRMAIDRAETNQT